jgi:hypothetical protein
VIYLVLIAGALSIAGLIYLALTIISDILKRVDL